MAINKPRYKQPEVLGRNRLLSLAMVMKEIKEQIDKGFTVSVQEYVMVDPYTTNVYFWNRDDCFGRGDTGTGQYLYSKAELKTSWLESLDYLRIGNAIVGIDVIKETREVNPPITSFVDYDYYGQDYTLQVMQPTFNDMYIVVKNLADNYIKNQQPYTDVVKTPDNTDISQHDSKQLYVVSLSLKGKQLYLNIDGRQSLVVKSFKSRKTNNVIALSILLNNKGKYLSKDDMHIPLAKSAIKDLPKTMGLENLLAQHFVFIDSKGQKLQMPSRVTGEP